jgi:hypothetical protein
MKTLITEFISLDGVVQAPEGANEDTDGGFDHGGWSMKYFEPSVMGGMYAELATQSDALMQGRRTYQVSAGAWPGRSEDIFSDWINRVQKYVVSNTLSEQDLTLSLIRVNLGYVPLPPTKRCFSVRVEARGGQLFVRVLGCAV